MTRLSPAEVPIQQLHVQGACYPEIYGRR